MKRGRPNTLSGMSRRARRLCRPPARSDRLGRDPGGGVALEQVFLGQLPVAGAEIARPDDRSVLHVQVSHSHAQSLGGGVEIDGARLGAGIAQRRARMLHRQAARGDALVGAHGRAGRHHAHARQIDVELVGHDLGDGREDALADLDLAGEHLHDPIGAQPQPLRQPPIGLQAAGQRHRVALIDDVIAETGTRAHAAAPSLAARSTARTMRLCAPQRHRLRSSAPRTSASLGSGLRCRSAAAEIRMPEMQ